MVVEVWFKGVYYYFYELTKSAISNYFNESPELSVGENIIAGAVAGYHL